MQNEKTDTFYPTTPKQWRSWLQKHHAKEESVWLIQYKKSSGRLSVSWSEAVDEALCFGWIDSKKKSIDEESSMQFFSRRKPKGTWSKINKEKVKALIAEGRMTKAGLDCIEAAKKNGSWAVLDSVEALKVPEDLEKEFRKHPGSKAFFLSLSRSVKKMMLQWLVLAKRPETREKRISEIAELAAQNRKPKQF